MSAGRLDLYIEQGAYYSLSFIWETADTIPVPIDLTGATAAMQIRDAQQGVIYLDATTANSKIVLGTTNGLVTLNFTSADTTLLSKRRLRYDLEITKPGSPSKPYRVLEGLVNISPNITQSPGEPVVT